jgi:hypothetical protein
MLEGVDGETYNVGSDRVVSIAELASIVRDLIAPNKSVSILGVPDSSLSRNRYVPSIRKIHALHALRPWVTLERAILGAAHARF